MNQFTGKGTTIVCEENDGDARQSSSLGFAWRMLLGTIRKTFPQAEQLRTSSLAAWLEDENRKKTVLLLDVRELDEYDISTLEGAICINPDGTDVQKVLEKVSKMKGTSPYGSVDIVCFCSLGYRSAKMAELIQVNLTKELEDPSSVTVYNLEGSIFKWANEKRPMIDNQGKRTVFCHPYSTVWGRFLNSDYRKWTP